MSIPKITSDNRSLIEAYCCILDHDPTKWDLYPHLAALLPTEAEKSHIYLQGAWHALEKGKYIQAQEFSTAAEGVYGRTFRARLIDIELLKRQGQSVAIPKKLLEISDTFKRKNLPAEEVKAYKRLAIIDPNPAHYQRIVILYTQIDKVQKASEWADKLPKIAPPRPLPPTPAQPLERPVSSFLKPAPSESKVAAPNLTPKPKETQLPDIAFGKALWAKYFGDVGEEPPLPPDIDKILNMPCPIWSSFFNRKKVRDTHFLLLVPETVNGKPLNLKTLGEIIQKPLQGKATKYESFYLGEYADPPNSESHWALMSRDVIPGTQGKKYQEQQTELTNLRKKTKLLYEIPTILDAAVCVFIDYIRTGIPLYSQDSWTFTRCQEKYNDSWQLVIGSSGIFGNYDLDNSGIAALTKFPYQMNEVQTDSEWANRPEKSDPPRTPKPSLLASPPPIQARKINTASKQPTQNQILARKPGKLPEIAFGKALWSKYFGDIGEEPPLPPDIDKILSDPCPIHEGKKVRETHLLVLVPQTVNGKPLTLKTLGELVQKPLQGNATKYRSFYIGEYNDPSAPQSQWVLMSRDVIRASNGKSYQTQQAQVTTLREKTDLPYYEVPSPLDAAVCILIEYVRTGTRLYSDEPWTYTLCQKKNNVSWNLVVGGFAPSGLRVAIRSYDDEYDGIAVLRKFSNPIFDKMRVPESAPTPYRFESLSRAPNHKKSTESKQRNSIENQIALHQPGKIPDIAFGKALWAKYFGDIGEEPPLPPDIDKILSDPCPIHEGKKVRETHLLVLVPQTVNGKPLTLKTLGDLVQKPLKGKATKYESFYLGEHIDAFNLKSQWVLMTRTVIPGTRNKSYQEQQTELANLRKKTKLLYEVPNVLDATVCIFIEYIRTGIYLYGQKPWTYTRCQEKYTSNRQLVVGSFDPSGLSVDSHYYRHDDVGVAALTKFSHQINEFQTDSEWPNRPEKSDPPRAIESISMPSLPASPPTIQAPKINTESKQPTKNQILACKPGKLPEIAFGKALWSKYFGHVIEEPPLPPEIDQILNNPCPFFPEEKICDTHMLVLIPQTINGIPLNLKTLGELVQKPLRGKEANYGIFNLGQYTDLPAPKSHWALMTRRIIPESQSKSYKEQYALLQGKKAPYEVPTILDATICIFMEYFRTGSYLYGRDPLIFTRCQERYNDSWQLDVGGFSPSGLDVNSHRHNFDCLGIAAVRKFSNQIIDTMAAPESVPTFYRFDSISRVPAYQKSTESKQHNSIENQIVLHRPGKVSDIAFGKTLWAKYFGDVGEEPPLPPDIEKILSDPCPIWRHKKVRETHLLVLVPQTVNGKPLTLKTLGELVQKPLQGNATKYDYIYLEQYSDPPNSKSHWALMSRNLLHESQNKSFKQQHAQVATLREETNLPYEVPTILDVTVSIFMEYVRTGNYIYGRDPWTYTRCQEKYNDKWQLVVGGFSSTGLCVSYCYDGTSTGIAPLRKFF